MRCKNLRCPKLHGDWLAAGERGCLNARALPHNTPPPWHNNQLDTSELVTVCRPLEMACSYYILCVRAMQHKCSRRPPVGELCVSIQSFVWVGNSRWCRLLQQHAWLMGHTVAQQHPAPRARPNTAKGLQRAVKAVHKTPDHSRVSRIMLSYPSCYPSLPVLEPEAV